MKIVLAIAIIVLVATGGYFLMKPDVPAEVPVVENTEPVETGTETTEGAGEVREFVVEGGMFYFAPEMMEVNKGDTVRIVFKNAEGKHDWVIDEFNARTAILDAGEEETIEFVADQTGSFEYYCSVGSHRAQGMKGTLTVK